MNEDFFKELEESFSNVGTDEVWEAVVGGRKIKLSPIPFTGQGKVQEALTNRDLGSNVIGESKRITLSHALVGIDNLDLRSYRSAGPVFGPVDMPGGKKLKVDLPTYIYIKLGSWGAQFIDDLFNVFADFMETHGKNNVKEVKFENSKNPADELGEVMVRMTELRIQLGLPPMVEKAPAEEVDEEAEFIKEQTDRAAQMKKDAEAESEEEAPEAPEAPAFDPFRTVEVASRKGSTPKPAPAPPARARPVDPEPVMTIPTVSPPQNVRRAQQAAELEGHVPSSTAQNPFIASASSDVIEAPAARPESSLPVIDPKQFGRNPRFSPPQG